MLRTAIIGHDRVAIARNAGCKQNRYDTDPNGVDLRSDPVTLHDGLERYAM